MGILDIIILLTLVISGVYGCWKGIVVQIGSLAGVVVGILSCRLFGVWLTGWCNQHIFSGMGDANTAHYVSLVVAYVTLFIVGYAVTRLLARLVQTVAKSLNLTVIDRILGAVFSIFQWMLVLSILINICTVIFSFNVLKYAELAHGAVGRAVADLLPVVMGFSYH